MGLPVFCYIKYVWMHLHYMSSKDFAKTVSRHEVSIQIGTRIYLMKGALKIIFLILWKKIDSYRDVCRIKYCNSCCQESTHLYKNLWLSFENMSCSTWLYIHSSNCLLFLEHSQSSLHELYPYVDGYSVSTHCFCLISSRNVRAFKWD